MILNKWDQRKNLGKNANKIVQYDRIEGET